jgi:hypothetical protein
MAVVMLPRLVVVVAGAPENKQIPAEEKQNQRQFVFGEAA